MKMKRKPMVKGRPAANASNQDKATLNRDRQGNIQASADAKGEQIRQEDSLITSWFDETKYDKGYKSKLKK